MTEVATTAAATTARTKISTATKVATHATTVAATTPSQASTWGSSGSAHTLVLYDSTGAYGYLGELYAIGAGNLATHFGPVTAEPVVDYQAGQVNDYTTTIYLGSTYNEPTTYDLPERRPVHHPAGAVGWRQHLATLGHAAQPTQPSRPRYGWDPSTSYFDYHRPAGQRDLQRAAAHPEPSGTVRSSDPI